jgi:Protein of unknown function (DUF3592)
MRKNFPRKAGLPTRPRARRNEPTYFSPLLSQLGIYKLGEWTDKKLGAPPAWSNNWNAPFALIFALIFSIVGSFTLLRIPYLFYLKDRLDEAIEVPAKILNIKQVSSGVRHRSSRLSLEYEYTIDGRVIRGNRPSIFSASDELSQRLRDAKESGREVMCYVDRNDPEFSAFEKDVRIMDVILYVIVGTPFSYIGGFFLIRYHGARRRRTLSQLP